MPDGSDSTTSLGPSLIDTGFERAVLGCILRSGHGCREIEEVGLRPRDLAMPQHEVVLEAILSLHGRGRPVDTLTVCGELERTRRLVAAGGGSGVAQLVAEWAPGASIRYHAQHLVELAQRRDLVRLCHIVSEAALDRSTKTAEVIEDIQAGALKLGRRGGVEVAIADRTTALDRVIASLDSPKAHGISTGFATLDKICRLGPGKLFVIAGRPAMGKSALAQQIGEHVADHEGPVAFIPLEMDPDECAERELMRATGSNRAEWASSREAYARACHARDRLLNRPLLTVDEHKLSIRDIQATARALHRKHDIKLLIVDYLQLVDGGEEYKGNKNLEVGEVSKGLKQLARELRIPVVVCCQLSRGVEQRSDKRPMLSDLRDSGQIEQDADVVAFPFRPEYYLRENTPAEWINVAEVNVAKHRGGPTGQALLAWHGHATRFGDLDRRHDEGSGHG